ncbi:MAG: hypothetical protein ACP5QK_00440 [Myxococcota bacterium]
MRKAIFIILGLIIISILLFALITRFYLPFECIKGDKSECISRASELSDKNLLKRVCSKIDRDGCITLLGMLHSKSKDDLIPYISDDYCNQNISAFCAFSSIAYSTDGDSSNAQNFALKGCDLNEGVSCAILAGIELDNEKDEDALKSSLKGCLLNSAAACAIAGTILINKGEEREGMQFIDRCCELGGEECCN